MALAGEAAVRIVPSLKGFHSEAKRKLEAKRIDYDVSVKADTRPFHQQMMAARALQEAKPVTIPVRTDYSGLKRELSQVEHIFQRNNLVKGIRLNVKIIGLDALPALAYAAGSAASGLDALAKSAFIIPGALAGAGAAAGALAVGLSGVGGAFKDFGKAAEDSSKNLKDVRDAQRDLQRAQRDVTGAIRDQRRELEDLNAEFRRASLDEADALLNIQESADRLKSGGFKSISEYQRAQLRFLRDVESLKDVRKNNIRLLEDTNEANAKGISQGDQVVSALDKVTSAVDRLNEAQKKSDGAASALGDVSPNAQKFIQQAYAMKGAWDDLRFSVQDNLFAGLDQSLAQLGSKVLPGLKVGLSEVASGLNSNVKAAVGAMGNGTNAGLWDSIFGNTTTGLENFKRSLDPILTGFSRMAEVGSTFLPRIGTAFETVGLKFDAWVTKIAADGTLKHWIDQGLDAVVSLGNLAKNVGSIISSVGEAFNIASGTEGGFIGFFDKKAREMAEYLKGDGRRSLIDYFTKAKELIHTVGTAFGDMKPLIRDLIEAARNFSMILLPVVGGIAKLAKVVDENLGLVRALFYAYAGYRTLRPIVDGLTGAWKNYKKVVGSAANFGPTASTFQTVNQGLTRATSNLKSLNGTVAFASSKLQPFTGNLSAAATSATKLLAPANNVAGSLNLLGSKAKYAGQQVGSAGVAASLRGALGGLATFIGPAIGAGILGIALSAGVLGLTKLGEAHDLAKDAARRQAEALSELKGSLDAITGAASAASLETAARVAQDFEMGPAAGGKRNVLDDAVKAGLGTPQQVISATLPQQQQLANDIEKKAIDQAAAKIAKSDSFTKYKEEWDKAGVTPEVLARAQIGQPDALAKIDQAERNIWGKPRRDFNWADRAASPNADARLPSISDTIVSAGTFEEAAVGSFLRGTRERNVNDSNAIKQATQAAGGKGTLKPEGEQRFGRFGANNNEVYVGPDGVGYLVVTADPGELEPELGQSEKLAGNQWKITLSKDATDKFLNVEKFATGGLIGGIGTGTSDSNLIRASAGEFVTRKSAVDHYGPGFFQRLNNLELPKFEGGGLIPPPVIPWNQAPGVAGSISSTIGITQGNKPDITVGGKSATTGWERATYNYPTSNPVSRALSATGRFFQGALGLGAPGYTETSTATISTADSAWNALREPPASGPDSSSPVVDPGSQLYGLPAGLKPSAPQTPPPVTPPASAPKPVAPASPAAAPTPVTSSPAATTAAPATSTGAKPSIGSTPAMGGGTPYNYALLNLAQKTGVAPSVLSKMLGMGGATSPYAGLPIGTDIKYGQAGFPDWVYKAAGRFGVQASTYAGHQEGSGSNKGIDWSGPVENMRAFAQYLTSAGIPGLEQVIFMDARDGAKFGVDPGDRGPNQTIEDYYRDDWGTHTDHIHTRVSGSIPTPEELAMLMSGTSAGGGLSGILGASGIPGLSLPGSLDINSLLQQGILGGDSAQGGVKKNPIQNFMDYWTNMDWLAPDKVTSFLSGQAQGVGSSLLNIGTSFLQGITGLDFSSVIGTGQQIGNFALGTAGDRDGGGGDEISTDVTALNGMSNEAIERYLNGEQSLGMSGELGSLLGPDLSSLIGMAGMGGLPGAGGASMSYNPGGGAEQWRPVVRRVLEQFAPQYGINNIQAWEDAIVRQIQSESNGDPGADNPNDSNGQGGKQHVSGLLQFLPQTFADNNITGGEYLDPIAQIAAVIPYVVNKYGMDKNGAPNQIGRGVGYARGGKIKGVGGPRADANLVRVSRGEFLHSANAVDHYGADFMSRLNSRQIPKESLPGFADGMWWNPLVPQPAPAPVAPAAPALAAPPPAAPPLAPPPVQPLAGGQSAGPLPGAAATPTAVAAPSTGGAPGPGATAPAPDPGALPEVTDALAGLGGALGGGGEGGLAQPGASGDPNADPRAILGSAPTTQNHNLSAVSAGIQGAASTIGSIAGTAASLAGNTFAPGAGSAAGAGIQAGAAMAGQVASGAVNILSSLLVGTATNGSTASASGVPLLPQRAPMQTGVPAMGGEQYQDNRTYNITNMDEYKRLQERDAAQAANPFIGKF